MKVEGHLGGIHDRKIIGWAVDMSSQRDLKVEIIFNGNSLGFVNCDSPRPDVKAHLKLSHANVGFVFHLPNTIKLTTGDRVDVRVNDQYSLPGSPYIHCRKSDFDSIRYLFLHIPKTAGTSFRTELELFLGPNRVFPGSHYLPHFDDRYPEVSLLQTEVIRHLDEIEAIVGHYPYQALRQLAPKANRLVFLRDPVNRSISFLRHAKRIWHSNSKTLEEIAGYDTGVPHPQISDLQTQLLSTATDQKLALESAIKNLEKFEFIGITEQYKLSAQMLNKRLGLSLKGSKRLNRKKIFTKPVSKELREFIEKANRKDRVLYQHACKLFARQEI